VPGLHRLVDWIIGLRGLLGDGVDGVLENLALSPRHRRTVGREATWMSAGVEDTLFALSRLRLAGDASDTARAIASPRDLGHRTRRLADAAAVR